MRRADQAPALLQRLSHIVFEKADELAMKSVGWLQLPNIDVDGDEQRPERLALQARRLRESRVIAVRRRLAPPGVGDRRGDIGAQFASDRLRARAIFAKPEVKLRQRGRVAAPA